MPWDTTVIDTLAELYLLATSSTAEDAIPTLALFTWLPGLPFHIHFRCFIYDHFIHLLYGLLMFTVSGNKPPSIYLYGWLLQAL